MKNLFISLCFVSVLYSCDRNDDVIAPLDENKENIITDTVSQSSQSRATTLLAESHKISSLIPDDLGPVYKLDYRNGMNISIIFRLQRNGNMLFFAVNNYNNWPKYLWNSGTANSGAYNPILLAQTNGNLVLYKNVENYSANDVLWNSNTWVAAGVSNPNIKIQLFKETSTWGTQYTAKLILEGNGYYRKVIAEGNLDGLL